MVAIPASARSVTYTPVNSAGPFPLDFPVFDGTGADLRVTLDEVEIAGWTFSGTIEAGFYGDPNTWINGDVTLSAPVTGSLRIDGKRMPRRVAQFQEGQGIPARDMNAALNTLTAVDQELRRDMDRVGDIPETLAYAIQVVNDATQLATPGDGTVSDPKVVTPASESLGIKDFKLARQHSKIASPAPIRSFQSYMDQGLTLVECATGPVGGGQDATTALQKLATECANLGFTGRIGRGEFVLNGTVVFDESGAATVDAPRGGLVGDGAGTIIRVASNITALDLRGGPSPGMGLHTRFGDFMLYRAGLAQNGIGIKLDNYAWSDFERIAIYGFGLGISATDFLSSTLRRVTIRNCERGMSIAYTDFSRPNALTFADLELGMNKEYGASINSPMALNWIGGAVEGNGIGGTGAYGFQGGVALVNGGDEGAVGVSFQSIDFEYNKGGADIIIDHTVNDCVYSVEGCTFNRISGTDYVTNNIAVSAGGTAAVIVGIERCSFKGWNDYVESAARPYIGVNTLTNLVVKVDDKTLFKDNIAYIDPAKWGTATRVGSVTAAGAANFLPRGWTCVKNSTGTYTVTHNLGTTGYSVAAVANSADSVTVERVLTSANSFAVVITGPTGALMDGAFTFTLSRA